MCGIFGIIVNKNSIYSLSLIKKLFYKLALVSESRGKESSGIAIRDSEKKEIRVIRSAMPISELLKSPEYKSDIIGRIDANYKKAPIAIIGHSRLVTDGSQLKEYNNQPVVKDGIVAIHNGIIVNVDELWKNHPQLTRKFEIDTEIMLSLIRENKSKYDTLKSVTDMLNMLFGTISSAMFFNDSDEIILLSNNGSLYILTDNKDIVIFASEKYMLETLKKKYFSWDIQTRLKIKQIKGLLPYIINVTNFTIDKKNSIGYKKEQSTINNFNFIIQDIKGKKEQTNSVINVDSISIRPEAEKERKMLQNNYSEINKLKRCTRCILPETFPFIEFDEAGVCNYCNNYSIKKIPKSINQLEKIVEPYRRFDGEPDVIVPYSGGRDSTFVLHYIKTILKMNPIAFTYDWGMVTDLARRNIARVCGKLRVENIIVSADIQMKRKNIKNNIIAWMKKPDIATIPLFMAGDKYFFYYCDELKKQTGIRLNIWGVNHLENTDFKSGFMGIKPDFNKEYIYSLSRYNKLKLFASIFQKFLDNPHYLNTSIFDTIGSYIVRYSIPKKDYYHFFDYYRWDEKEVVNTIIKKYDWETAKDTDVTWRIGDGTASFYNYIYYTIAGFTESDTFRSNQIREKILNREEALKITRIENKPRYESIKWYLEIINMDYKYTIDIVNNIPKLY